MLGVVIYTILPLGALAALSMRNPAPSPEGHHLSSTIMKGNARKPDTPSKRASDGVLF